MLVVEAVECVGVYVVLLSAVRKHPCEPRREACFMFQAESR